MPAAPQKLSREALRLLEREAAEAARAEDWVDVLAHLDEIYRRAPDRYTDGRFEFLTARALAGLGRVDEALVRFERFAAPGDLFDVPARLAAARLRFGTGDGTGALDLLLPLLQRKEGAISRRALRTALDALETRFDAAALARLVAARPQTPPRERRRLQALRAEALEREGAATEAAALRLSLLAEGRRDDAAAALLARELAGRTPADHVDATLRLLVDTARSQRDLELAERLAAERERRAVAGSDAAEAATARFELARLRGSRGRFAEAASGFAALLDATPKRFRPPAGKGDDGFGTAAFAGRVRFNLGAMKEKLGDLDGAVEEFRRGRVGAPPLLVERRAESGEGAGAARALAPVAVLAKARRLPEPWLSELPFWTGLVARARNDVATALSEWAALLAADPGSFAAERALARIEELPVASRERFVATARADGRRLLRAGKAAAAKDRLLPATALGDAEAKEALREAYRALPRYADVLLAPELPDESLPDLCGDAAACRLLQLGLAEDAEPIVREARLDTLLGSLVAARLAEDAGAGPAALEAAEAVSRKVPRDFLLELAPRTIRRGLAPRPFDRLVAQAAAELRGPPGPPQPHMRPESPFHRAAAPPAA
ncbi:MAG TPA: hypothetical protein PKA62_17675, partial [Thermoanaerobaculia bacterium]|nr:hypothetical protein [Thermoanaerobaculia bacterium]